MDKDWVDRVPDFADMDAASQLVLLLLYERRPEAVSREEGFRLFKEAWEEFGSVEAAVAGVLERIRRRQVLH